MMEIRRAISNDITGCIDLVEELRVRYEQYQPRL